MSRVYDRPNVMKPCKTCGKSFMTHTDGLMEDCFTCRTEKLEEKLEADKANQETWKRVIKRDYRGGYKEYTCLDSTGFGTSGGRKGNKPDEVKETDRKKTIERAKRRLRRLCLANGIGKVHITLTYKVPQENADEADKHFKDFIYELRQEYPHLKYCATREIQLKRQADTGKSVVHYHVLFNHRLPIKKVQKIWGKGWCWVTPHETAYQAVKYVLKYITKELEIMDFKTSQGNRKKAYLCSQGLQSELDFRTSEFFIKQPANQTIFDYDMQELKNEGEVLWEYKFTVDIGQEKEIECWSMLVKMAG